MFVAFTNDLDLFELRFEAIDATNDSLNGITVPSVLESRLLKQYPLTAGDFLFMEWQTLTEDILVMSDRCALISAQTCNLQLQFISAHFGNFIISIISSCLTNSSCHDAVDFPGTKIALSIGNGC